MTIEFDKHPFIVFSGRPTGQCKKFMQKRESKLLLFASIGGSCLIGIPTIIALTMFTSIGVLWTLGLCVPVILLFVSFCGLSPYIKGVESSILPSEIILHDDGHMESIGETFHWVQMIDDVEYVIDYGLWYQINFIHTEKNLRFICQKDLLVQGTIEDFEKMFDGKLIRK